MLLCKLLFNNLTEAVGKELLNIASLSNLLHYGQQIASLSLSIFSEFYS